MERQGAQNEHSPDLGLPSHERGVPQAALPWPPAPLPASSTHPVLHVPLGEATTLSCTPLRFHSTSKPWNHREHHVGPGIGAVGTPFVHWGCEGSMGMRVREAHLGTWQEGQGGGAEAAPNCHSPPCS